MDPSIVCMGGRNMWQYHYEGTVSVASVQSGPTPDSRINIPTLEATIQTAHEAVGKRKSNKSMREFMLSISVHDIF